MTLRLNLKTQIKEATCLDICIAKTKTSQVRVSCLVVEWLLRSRIVVCWIGKDSLLRRPLQKQRCLPECWTICQGCGWLLKKLYLHVLSCYIAQKHLEQFWSCSRSCKAASWRSFFSDQSTQGKKTKSTLRNQKVSFILDRFHTRCCDGNYWWVRVLFAVDINRY